MIDASPALSTPPTRQAILAPELLLADRVDALTEALRHEEHLVQTLLATVRMAQERIDALRPRTQPPPADRGARRHPRRNANALGRAVDSANGNADAILWPFCSDIAGSPVFWPSGRSSASGAVLCVFTARSPRLVQGGEHRPQPGARGPAAGALKRPPYRPRPPQTALHGAPGQIKTPRKTYWFLRGVRDRPPT